MQVLKLKSIAVLMLLFASSILFVNMSFSPFGVRCFELSISYTGLQKFATPKLQKFAKQNPAFAGLVL
jgi:hypothetical protein